MNILKLVALLIASSMTFAEVPQLINYQGQLTDADGKSKEGTVNLSFTIYDSATGTNVLWGPQTFSNVPLIEGSFNIILGPNDDSDAGSDPIADAFATPNSYLQITDMGADTTDDDSDDTVISPRQQILSTPYAIKAETADKATHHSNIVPPGTIMSFAGPTSNIPTGWLLCNGGIYDADTQPELLGLLSAIGKNYGGGSGATNSFNVPDLRGLFIRGLDEGRGVDPNRGLGSVQDDILKTHIHGVPVIGSGTNGDVGQLSNGYVNGNFSAIDSLPYEGGTETRPKNLAFHYIIKY